MRFLRFSALLVVAIPSLGSGGGAQSRPTSTQAQAMLQARPELVEQLRQRIVSSGMTPEQVRARLRAEGYPENLLDPYLGQGSVRGQAPDSDVFDAVRALGLTDETDLAELRRLAGLGNSTTRARSDALRDSVRADSGLTIFGLSLFRDATSLFLPNLDGPVDAGYRLGPGDQLVLILTGDVELAHTLDVTREGFVVIPQVGQLGVANLTMGELEDLLYSRLSRAYSGIRRGAGATTRFTVSVSKLRSNQVFVTGDVMSPGSYRVTSAGTALTALYAAGGPTDLGSLRRVEIRRGGSLVSTLDVYDYLLRGDGAQDVRLQQGDFVFVPPRGPRARIVGAVARPATYEMRAGETLTDLVRASGGLKASAGGRRLLVERILPMGTREPGRDRAMVEVPLAGDGAVPSIPVEDGDVVRVPAIGDRVRGGIVVKGHVRSSGAQGFSSGLTLAQALARAGGPKSDAYLGTVHISRLQSDSTRLQMRAMLRDTTGATFEDVPLQEDDEITVYSRTEFRPDRYVAVGGAVRKGGRFPWREGMTLRDVVIMAGGLDEHAFLGRAEIARVPDEPNGKLMAVTIAVSLDSSYHVDLGAASPRRVPEFELAPFDYVLILRDPSYRSPQTVLLTGEVMFPGRYTLLTRTDRLSDVINRAGGLTKEGDADGAYFARLVDTVTSMRLRTTETRRMLGAMGAGDSVTTSDSVQAKARAASFDDVKDRIRVGVDLRDALRRPRRSDDLILEGGDSIHVPKVRQTVEVRGAVNAPTALAHANARLGHYIFAAGGPTELARAGRAYVIQPDGKIESRRHFLWFVTLDPKPRPGATVVVPARTEAMQPANTLATLAVVTQMIASLAAIVVLTR